MQYQWLLWTAMSVEMYVESIQPVPVAVVDSIVNRNVCGVCTGRTGDCCVQYCQ